LEAQVRDRYARQAETLRAEIVRAKAVDTSAEAGGSDRSPVELQETLAALEERISNDVAAVRLEHSLLGRAGKLVAPVVRPLGWDWRIGCAVIASFPAREIVIGTLGVIYHLGSEQDEQSESLRQTLRSATWPETGRQVFNIPVALSIMVFYALCAQCAATLAVIRRETGSWRWPMFTFAYMTTLAYLGALVTYQAGMLFTGP
jgi:ferrous iron transport protein B